MSYFKRLIRSTGIHIGERENMPASTYGKQKGTGLTGETSPIHVEETKITEPSASTSATAPGEVIDKQPPELTISNSSEKPTLIANIKRDHAVKQNGIGSSVPAQDIEDDAHTDIESRTISQKLGPKAARKRLLIKESVSEKVKKDIQLAPDPANEIASNDELIRKPGLPSGQTIIESLSAQPANFPQSYPETDRNNGLDNQSAGRIFFKDVRDWVAESSADEINPRPPENLLTIDKEMTTKKEMPLYVPVEKSRQSEFLRQVPRLSDEPEVHDYQISIGTISLTVDNQQAAIQPPPTPTRPPGEKPAKTRSESRLARHYLRIR